MTHEVWFWLCFRYWVLDTLSAICYLAGERCLMQLDGHGAGRAWYYKTTDEMTENHPRHSGLCGTLSIFDPLLTGRVM